MAKKKTSATAEIPTESSKDTEEGFRGGLKLPLDRVTDKGTRLRDDLSAHVKQVFEQERRNHKSLEEKIQKWQNMYFGIKPAKSWPWEGCANVAVPITRSSVDTIFSRAFDAIFNKSKVWLVRARKPEYIDMAKEVEDSLDWFQRNILHLKDKVKSPLLQAIKMGTGIGKNVYERKRRTAYRYPTQDEASNNAIHKYPLGEDGEKGIKFVKTVYDGPNFYPVSREDFLISSDATDIEGAYLCGHRMYMRRAQLDSKVKQGLYDKEAVDKISAPDTVDEVKEGRIASSNLGTERIGYTEPFEVWELWTRYDVDNDGEEDEIMVVYHPSSGQILRGIYSPLFSGARPYVKFTFYPKEFSFDGEGCVQILEHLQELLDTLVNQMVDRITMINCPILFYREGSGVEDIKTLRPGMKYPIPDNPAEAIYEVRTSDQTLSLANEISWIMSMMDRALGITPISLGISTAERPVAKDTFAQQEETNKKFKFGIENIRDGLTEEGYTILEFLAQYQPAFKYEAKDGSGKMEMRTVQFPVDYIRDAFEIELVASSELINNEVRREIYIATYQLLSDFMTKLGSMAQMLTSPQVPSTFKQIIFDANDKSVKIMNKILEQFPDLKDSASLILDIKTSLGEQGVQQVMMQSADVIAQQQQMAQQQAAEQQPPQGPPPEQGPPMEEQPMVGPEQMLTGGQPNA